MIADPKVIKEFATRTKCLMCKHKFDKPVILPVDSPVHGKFQPNFNVDVAWHIQDTHGIDHATFRHWIVASIYGDELTEFGSRKLGNIFRGSNE